MDIDTDMEFPQHLGMDNDALDINDINFMDENILKSESFHVCKSDPNPCPPCLQAYCRTVRLTRGLRGASSPPTTPSPPT